MVNNVFFKFITSIPVIVITMFFIPILGVILLLFRFYLKKKNDITTSFIVLGILLVIPKILVSIFDLINFDSSKIPYFDKIVNSNIYDKLLFYGKALITIGVVVAILFFIISNLIRKISSKVETGVKDYIKREEQRDREVKEKNDMIMRERKEIVDNMHTVKCPYCGGSNVLTSKIGSCKYCRKPLEYKE